MESQVILNNIKSSKFEICIGVKQGGVISSLLFAVYSKILINNLLSCKAGCRIGDIIASVILYADDIVLLAPTRSSMQRLLNICEGYGRKYSMQF